MNAAVEPPFSYEAAFARTLGWVNPLELSVLRRKRVAIAGLGGVGGHHLLTLTRLGVGAFHVADFDAFDVPNLNRQAGAFVSTLGRPKVDVLTEMAREINPELSIRAFPQGVTPDCVDAFLAGVDLYIDGLDFFALPARRLVFARCAALGIPAITAAPLGMGAAMLVFLPGQMSFEEYFRLEGQTEAEQSVRFLIGLAPWPLQNRYLVDASRVDLARKTGPSTIIACNLCAALAATEALKILLERGPVRVAPRGWHFDAYRHRLVKTWRPFGNGNPIQRLALMIGRIKWRRAGG